MTQTLCYSPTMSQAPDPKHAGLRSGVTACGPVSLNTQSDRGTKRGPGNPAKGLCISGLLGFWGPLGGEAPSAMQDRGCTGRGGHLLPQPGPRPTFRSVRSQEP